jgi:steroid 5-alpha reductase family enzyme
MSILLPSTPPMPRRYSRHPNFFAEQLLWWGMYLFAVSATGRYLHWSAAGTAALTMLFQGSTWLTELISVSKYPA